MAVTYKTPRQQEIVNNAAKQFGVDPNSITGFTEEFDVPASITYSSSTGNFTRDIRPLYGSLLKDTEYQSLLTNRADANAGILENLNGYQELIGQTKKPIAVESGNLVKQNTTSNSFNSSSGRLAAAGLPKGAQAGAGGTSPIIKFKNSNGADHRVRILVPSALQSILLGSAPVAPLVDTNGVLFPYTPQITLNYAANYDQQNLTHSNYAYQFYQSSTVEEISIQATFAAKNATDAAYMIAAQQFFRTVTKMFYGQDAYAGVPPPVLRLDGHGDLQFSSVPVVITGFSANYPDDVDYITASTSSVTASEFRAAETNPMTAGSLDSNKFETRVPVIQTFSVNCRPVYSRASISGNFSVSKFVAGQLLGTDARGGFL
jgi:hypothetical protein